MSPKNEDEIDEAVLAELKALNEEADELEFTGEFERALEVGKKALAIYERELGPDHPEVAGGLRFQGSLYYNMGRFAEAEMIEKRSLATFEVALGPDHPEVAISLNRLAEVYRAMGQQTQEELSYRRILAIHEKVGGIRLNIAGVLKNFATLCLSQGRYVEAEPLLKRALATEMNDHGRNSPRMPEIYEVLARLYRATGREKEAEELETRAALMREATGKGVLQKCFLTAAHLLRTLIRYFRNLFK